VKRISGCLIGILLFAEVGLSLDLKTALDLARQQPWDKQKYQSQISAVKAETGRVDGVFDSKIFATSQFTDDQSPSQSLFSGDGRSIEQHSVGVQKLFSTGTQAEVKLSLQKTKVEFGDPPATTPPSPVLFDPASSFEENPEYLSKGELTLSQPFLRQWGAREAAIEKRLILHQSLSPRFQYLIQQQTLQYQIEVLFWQLASVVNQVKNGETLLQLARENLRLTKVRVATGRTDPVDVAAAESLRERYSGSLLELNLARKKIEQRLTHLIYPGTFRSVAFRPPSLLTPPLASLSGRPEELFEKAKTHRQDLALLDQASTPLELQLDLAKEQSRPSLDGFVTASLAGLDGRSDQSFGALVDGKHPSYTLGVKLQWNPSQTAYQGTRRLVADKRQELGIQREQLLQQIKRDLHLATESVEDAKLRANQATNQIDSFRKQIRGERRRIEQARSSEIVVIRYEMDIVTSENTKFDALSQQRIGEAEIRYLTHSYPQAALGH
jgi:outer membrane protein TolC